jgi:hypothetical protein
MILVLGYSGTIDGKTLPLLELRFNPYYFVLVPMVIRHPQYSLDQILEGLDFSQSPSHMHTLDDNHKKTSELREFNQAECNGLTLVSPKRGNYSLSTFFRDKNDLLTKAEQTSPPVPTAAPDGSPTSSVPSRRTPRAIQRHTTPFRWPFGPWQTVFIVGSAAFCLWMLGGIIVSALVLSGVGVPAGLFFAFVLTTKATHAMALSSLIGNAILIPILGGLSAFYAYCMYRWNTAFGNTFNPSQTHNSSPPAISFKATLEEKPQSKRFNLLESLRNCCREEHSPDESETPLIPPPTDERVSVSPTSPAVLGSSS